MISFKATQEQRIRFGQELFLHRRKLKLSQEEFADLVGVSRWTLSQWENGKHFPCEKFIFLLGRALGLDVTIWFNPDPPPPATSARQVVIKEIIIQAKPIATLIPGSRTREDEYEFAS